VGKINMGEQSHLASDLIKMMSYTKPKFQGDGREQKSEHRVTLNKQNYET
jgi:hypothetical protein